MLSLVLVEPEFYLTMVEIKTNENWSRRRVVESLHCLFLAERIESANVDVLAANRADDLPEMHSRAERHIGQN